MGIESLGGSELQNPDPFPTRAVSGFGSGGLGFGAWGLRFEAWR